MADDTSRLPEVVPPREVTTAASGDGENLDLAYREQAQLDRAMSVHRLDQEALKTELARAYIDNLKSDRTMRETYAGRILEYLECYSLIVAFLLLLDGWHFGGFDLDLEVVAALVGSTALAAIGLVGFIARGLFRPLPPPPAG